jgi:hypothetical protein
MILDLDQRSVPTSQYPYASSGNTKQRKVGSADFISALYYKLWKQNPRVGRIPPQRTDTGCFLMTEVFGARKMIYVKDEDGLFPADPRRTSLPPTSPGSPSASLGPALSTTSSSRGRPST